jgi:Ran GTPase-activating protein (RanGAP) involved in mRNA processing and transport
MKMKKLLMMLVVFMAVNAHANPCIDSMDKRIEKNNLNLNACELTTKDIPKILSFLSLHPSIQSLDLSKNRIDDAGVIELVENNSIKTLDLSENKIDEAGLIALAHSQSLINLTLKSVFISNRAAEEFGENTALDSLAMTSDDIQDVVSSVRLLARNHKLSQLDLSGKACRGGGIGEHGAIALAKNKTLTKLILSCNGIGDMGGNALAQSKTIRYLEIEYNFLNKWSISALQHNPNITFLHIGKQNVIKK